MRSIFLHFSRPLLGFVSALPAQMLRLSFLLSIAFHACPTVSAQTARPDSPRVLQESWTAQQGAPEDIQSFAQTTDGFLWLGGANGLFRFDGTRFERFRASSGDQLLSTNVYAVSAETSGGLWVGYTFGGCSFVNHGQVKNYPTISGTVWQFANDSHGIVWAAASTGLWRFEHSTWQHLGSEANVPAGNIVSVGFDRNGVLWAMAQTALLYLRPGEKQFRVADEDMSTAGLFARDADGMVLTSQAPLRKAPPSSGDSNDGLHAYPIRGKDSGLIIDRTNSVWILARTDKSLMRIPTPRQITDALTETKTDNHETYDIHTDWHSGFVDHEGNVWFADRKGIYRFYYSSLNEQNLPDEQRSFAIAADDAGAVWISTGLDSDLLHVANGIMETHPVRGYVGPWEGGAHYWTLAHRALDKTFWFGGKKGLWHLVGRNFVPVNVPREMMDQMQFLQAIAEDRAGGLWISFGRHGLYRLAEGVWTPFGGKDDFPRTGVVTEFSDSLGRVWFGFTRNQLAVLDGDRLELFGAKDGIRVGNITAVYGRGSQIWIGGEFGLQEFDQRRFRNIIAVDNDWLLGISGIVETPNGDLWLNGLSGILKINRDEISKALRDPSYQVRGQHLGNRDGVPGNAAQIRPLPTAIEGSDGRLWFAERGGVVWLDPTLPLRTAQPAPITIQSVSADDKEYSAVFPLTLPAHTSSVQIIYAAVSLSDPEAIRFRYKLESDPNWHEATRQDPVTYRNLAPGRYHFVIADSDTDGVWSDKVANVDFTILPAWYQTKWFRTACVGAFLLLLWALYQLRLRQLRQQFSIGLEARVNERTRIARELHDTLLQSFQALLLRLQSASNLWLARPDEAKRKLDLAIEQGSQAIAEGRDAVQGLRSSTLVTNDLAVAIRTVSEELAATETNQIPPIVEVAVEGASKELHPIVRDEVFRIAAEVLRNAFRHAQAKRIEVEIQYDTHQLRLRIRDDGKGMDAQLLGGEGRTGHFGLHGIRERAQLMAGKVELWSNVGSGTELELTIPASAAYDTRHPRRSSSVSNKEE